MDYFYLNHNEQDNGDHEVHRHHCDWLPEAENREYLGQYHWSSTAIAEARSRHPYWLINGCYHCCPESHTS